jgi:sulfhydrogenase subunit beta (sulfur reductase)
MEMDRFLSWENFGRLIQRMGSSFSVFVPITSDGRHYFEPAPRVPESVVGLPPVRTEDSVKAFFFPLRTEVIPVRPEVFTSDGEGPLALVGVRECDLRALALLDLVFLTGDYVDPHYQARREEALLVSVDCWEPYETCCCTLVGGGPFVEAGSDFNLAPVTGGLLAGAGSDRGEEVLATHRQLFHSATDEMEREMSEHRRATVERLRTLNAPFSLDLETIAEVVMGDLDAKAWTLHSRTCVECGACEHACPTCRCFLLYDQVRKGVPERFRTWDVCFNQGYARMAGGLTPRPRLVDRFRNRLQCKFGFLPRTYGMLGCTGCGRCIAGCMGKIEMRQTLTDLSRQVPAPASGES